MSMNIISDYCVAMARYARVSWMASALCLAACTSGPPVNTLRVAAHPDTIVLGEVAAYDVPARLLGSDWHFSVEPGTYTAEKEDDQGTYFRAQGYPVTVDTGATTNLVWTHAGGIWVPRDASKSPRIYYYADERRPKGMVENPGAAYGVIVHAEAGKVQLVYDAKDARFAATVRANLHSATR